MNGHQQRSRRCPKLLVTVKHETDDRSVTETYPNSHKRRSKNNHRPTNFHPTTIYYNSNYRQKQHFTRSPPATVQHCSPNYDRLSYRYSQQPIRPLMEIKDNRFYVYPNFDDDEHDEITYLTYKQREAQQRGQYRNRKAELDWDHAFDLDQIHLYTTQHDIDNHSLTSFHSSSDNSFSSV